MCYYLPKTIIAASLAWLLVLSFHPVSLVKYSGLGLVLPIDGGGDWKGMSRSVRKSSHMEQSLLMDPAPCSLEMLPYSCRKVLRLRASSKMTSMETLFTFAVAFHQSTNAIALWIGNVSI